MVPRFALIGCGPEAFIREFLAYKSFDLARRDALTNNESSHDSYLDTAISFGLPGAIAYVALIASSFMLLIKTRRRSADPKTRLIATGLVGSLAAVVTHNVFIYDQIPTGLYFLVFAALALAALNVASSDAARSGAMARGPSASLRLAGYATAILGALSLVAALWFSESLALADIAIKQAMVAAREQDFETIAAVERRATGSLDPTGSYDFEFARTLTLYADTISKKGGSPSSSVAEEQVESIRSRAIEAAIGHAERSLAHTLTPDATYVLLACLALDKGDIEQLYAHSSKAIRWDPYYFNARWLMGEALLARGDREGAIREAQFALRLRPASSEARSVLARASGAPELVNPRIQGLVERARLLFEQDKLEKAEELLKRAIRDAGGPCPQCHRLLALTYEKAQRPEDAAAEWEAYSRETAFKRKHNLLPDQ
jgi:tetratricopeptide (TPR) repeat protein